VDVSSLSSADPGRREIQTAEAVDFVNLLVELDMHLTGMPETAARRRQIEQRIVAPQAWLATWQAYTLSDDRTRIRMSFHGDTGAMRISLDPEACSAWARERWPTAEHLLNPLSLFLTRALRRSA
jgi:hypothetical protein